MQVMERYILKAKASCLRPPKLKRKKAKSLTLSFANSLKNADESVINREAYNNLIDGVGGVTKRTTGNIVSKTPLSDHITKRRILNGPYAKVEKILKSKKNSLNEEDSYNNDSYSFTGLNNEENKETEE